MWAYLIAHHRHLGHPRPPVEHLKQRIAIEDQVVRCLGWASAAFKVGARDRWIGWREQTRRRHLHLLISNVRFLLSPWVRIKCLASKVLAQSACGLCAHWERRYGHPVVLAKTFVDPQRFAGTCYRAANWQALGQIGGHTKANSVKSCTSLLVFSPAVRVASAVT